MAGRGIKKIFRRSGVDLAKTGVGTVAAIVEESTGVPVSSLIEAGFDIQDIMDNLKKGDVMPNPLMVENGLGMEEASPCTKKYLHKRKLKKSVRLH